MSPILASFETVRQEQRSREILGHTAYRISAPEEEDAGIIRYGFNLSNGLGVILEERQIRPDFDGSPDDEIRILEKEAGFYDIEVRCKKANNFHLFFDPSIVSPGIILAETLEHLSNWTPDSPKFFPDRDLAIEAVVASDLTGIFRNGARKFETQFPQTPSFTGPEYIKVSDALVEELELEMQKTLELAPEQHPLVQRIRYSAYAECLKNACLALSAQDDRLYFLHLQVGLLMTERYLPKGFSRRVESLLTSPFSKTQLAQLKIAAAQ